MLCKSSPDQATDLPIAIRNAPDQGSHLFVVQRNSGIERVDLAQNTSITFLSLAAHLAETEKPRRRLATNSENGILSLAFHPDYKNDVIGSGIQPSSLSRCAFPAR